MSQKTIELAKKLMNLSKKGVGGEMENAQRKLKSLMEKHGITEEMLDEDVVREYDFRVKLDQMRMCIQVLASITEVERQTWTLSQGNKKFFRYEATVSEHVEFLSKFPFYWDRFTEERELLYEAFIHRNDLYDRNPPSTLRDWDSLSQEEKDRWNRVNDMSQGLTRHKFRKQIGG